VVSPVSVPVPVEPIRHCQLAGSCPLCLMLGKRSRSPACIGGDPIYADAYWRMEPARDAAWISLFDPHRGRRCSIGLIRSSLARRIGEMTLILVQNFHRSSARMLVLPLRSDHEVHRPGMLGLSLELTSILPARTRASSKIGDSGHHGDPTAPHGPILTHDTLRDGHRLGVPGPRPPFHHACPRPAVRPI